LIPLTDLTIGNDLQRIQLITDSKVNTRSGFTFAMHARDLEIYRPVIKLACGATLCDSTHGEEIKCPALSASPTQQYVVRVHCSLLDQDDIPFQSLSFSKLFFDFEANLKCPDRTEVRTHFNTEWKKIINNNCSVAIEGIFYQRREEEGKETRDPRIRIVKITPLNPPVLKIMKNAVQQPGDFGRLEIDVPQVPQVQGTIGQAVRRQQERREVEGHADQDHQQAADDDGN